MIPNEEEWHYLAVKNLSSVLGGITSKHHGDCYCLNCLYFFRTEYKLKSHKKVCENKDFCNVAMLSEGTRILEFNQYHNLIRHHLLIMQIFNVHQEGLMDVKIILKIYLQQKQVNISHQVFQCVQYHDLKAQKISMMYTDVKIT